MEHSNTKKETSEYSSSEYHSVSNNDDYKCYYCQDVATFAMKN